MIPENFDELLRSNNKTEVQDAHTAMKVAIAKAEKRPGADWKEIYQAKYAKLQLKLHLHKIGGMTKSEEEDARKHRGSATESKAKTAAIAA